MKRKSLISLELIGASYRKGIASTANSTCSWCRVSKQRNDLHVLERKTCQPLHRQARQGGIRGLKAQCSAVSNSITGAQLLSRFDSQGLAKMLSPNEVSKDSIDKVKNGSFYYPGEELSDRKMDKTAWDESLLEELCDWTEKALGKL